MIGRLSEVTLKNKKGLTVELLPSMPANTAELVYSVVLLYPQLHVQYSLARPLLYI